MQQPWRAPARHLITRCRGSETILSNFSRRRYGLIHRQWLHDSSPKPAIPLPDPPAPGPPPGPPERTVSDSECRLERKRRQAELLNAGRNLKAKEAKPALQRRFWKEVSVEEKADGFRILLDGRPIRTASKTVLTVPLNKGQLAAAIALEWDHLVSAQQALKQHYIPLTSLTSRAIDIQSNDTTGNKRLRDEIVNNLMSYLVTDTLLCWAPERSNQDALLHNNERQGSKTLRTLQEEIAEPIVAYLTTSIWPGVKLVPILEANSILPMPQPGMTQEFIREWIYRLPAFELTALERGVLASKSLLVAARLLAEWSTHFSDTRKDRSIDDRFGIEEALEACTSEVRWQTDMWGEVEDTHDVDKEDMRRQLGSVILLVSS